MALHRRLDVVVLEVDREQTERGNRAGRRRDQRRAEPQEVDEPAGLEGPGATEGDQRVVARIEAALDAHLLDGVGLVPGRDLDDPVGGALRGKAELGGQGFDPLPGEVGRQWHLPAQKVRRDAPEDELGVRHRGTRAAPAVAHRARVGARAGGPDPEATVRRSPRDRAASRPHGDQIDHRHLEGKPPDGAVGRDARLAALDQTDVGAGPARVQGEHAIATGGRGEEAGAERAGGRAAQDRRDRVADHLTSRDHPAVGLHHLEWRAGPELGVQAGADPLHVARDPALGEGVDERRHRALVLAILGPDLGRERDVRLRVLA